MSLSCWLSLCILVISHNLFHLSKFCKGNIISMSGFAKTKDSKSEPIAYSEAALRNNAIVVEYCRTSMAALSGSTAGVLGLTALYGFAFYVFAVFTLWFMFMIKAGPNWQKYYVSRQSLLTNGFFGALFTYVLFWTFIYGMVHVY